MNKALLKITWIELALAFQIQTGFRLAHDRLDLHEQERAFRGATKRIWNSTQVKCNGARQSTKEAWHPAPGIGSLKSIIGHARTGFCRRPVLDKETWHKVSIICLQAQDLCSGQEGFAKGFKPSIPRRVDGWTAAINFKLQAFLSTGFCAEEQDETTMICHFGHATTSNKKGKRHVWNANPPQSWWPGRVPGGVRLCNQCYQIGYRGTKKGRAPLPKQVGSVLSQVC